MTFTDQARRMRRVADAIDRAVAKEGRDKETGIAKPLYDGEMAVGAAMMLLYIRDFVTAWNAEFDRPTMLVLLETFSRDPDLFPCGIAKLLWDAEEPCQP